MKSRCRIAVTSRSFSRHPMLRQELLSRYENVTFNDEGLSLEGDSLVKFLQGYEKAITALETINESVLSKLPNLKVISKVGVGIDMIDLQAMDRHGVLLGWTRGTNKRSVSELVLTLMLMLLRHVLPSSIEVRLGGWKQRKGNLLSGRTVGLVGCGNVGRDLVALLKPFECKVLCYDVISLSDFCQATGAQSLPLDALLSQSDIVSLHLPLNQVTANILNSSRLALMRSGSCLVNTSRGGLVDEIALKEALKSGKLLGAAFDVFGVEPPVDKELLALPNFVATPHIGGSTEEAILAMGKAAIEGLETARPTREYIQ